MAAITALTTGTSRNIFTDLVEEGDTFVHVVSVAEDVGNLVLETEMVTMEMVSILVAMVTVLPG